MNPDNAAARVSMALRPSFRPDLVLLRYLDFFREVRDEAGPAEVARIVHVIERNAALTGRAA